MVSLGVVLRVSGASGITRLRVRSDLGRLRADTSPRVRRDSSPVSEGERPGLPVGTEKGFETLRSRQGPVVSLVRHLGSLLPGDKRTTRRSGHSGLDPSRDDSCPDSPVRNPRVLKSARSVGEGRPLVEDLFPLDTPLSFQLGCLREDDFRPRLPWDVRSRLAPGLLRSLEWEAQGVPVGGRE